MLGANVRLVVQLTAVARDGANGSLEAQRPARAVPPVLQWAMIAVAIALAVLALASAIRTTVDWNIPDMGWTTTGDFTRVSVEPGSAAERAGLRSGDRLVMTAMTVADRSELFVDTIAGRSFTVVVDRAGARRSFTYVVPIEPRKPEVLISLYTGACIGAFLFLLTAFVLARRPSLDAVALWMFAVLFANVGVLAEFATSTPALTAIVIVQTLLSSLGPAGIIWLFLRATPASPLRSNLARANIAFWTALALYSAFANVRQLITGEVPPAFVQTFFAYSGAFICTLVPCLAIVAVGFARSRGVARVRLQWFAAALGFYCAGVALVLATAAVPGLAFSTVLQLVLSICLYTGSLLLAVPILRHDLFGVGFVINRAAIYAIVTGVVVGAFAGINWLIGLALKSTGLALPVDVVLAAAAGLSLNLVQRRVNRLVDRVLFRRRYEAARRLRRVARALAQVTDDGAIRSAIVVEPCEALDLHAAAFFSRAEDGSFERVAMHGWPAGTTDAVAANDRFVVYLLGGDDTPLRMDDVPQPAGLPHGAPRPRMVFPLWSRRELIGFALYSAHRSGATLDPEEVDSIERIVTASTAAFDRVAAAALRRTLEELATVRAENARLIALVQG